MPRRSVDSKTLKCCCCSFGKGWRCCNATLGLYGCHISLVFGIYCCQQHIYIRHLSDISQPQGFRQDGDQHYSFVCRHICHLTSSILNRTLLHLCFYGLSILDDGRYYIVCSTPRDSHAILEQTTCCCSMPLAYLGSCLFPYRCVHLSYFKSRRSVN